MTHPIGQHFLAGFDGYSVTPEVRDLILSDKVLGFTLFKWNIESAEQLRSLNDELKALAQQAGYELILAVDQEGGRVQRLPEPYSKIPPMLKWQEICDKNQSNGFLFECGKILGCEVRTAGFNLDFAPVVDVNTYAENPIIGDRSFSSDPKVVYESAKQVIRGLISESVIPCLKHFPGHGATSKDSHLELPVDERNFNEIWSVDVLPYKKLIADNLAATLMTAHVLYPKLDPNQPATLSKRIIHDLLREELGYEGVVFSDDFLMKAICDNYDLAQAAQTFFSIGGDVVLVCKQPELTTELIAKTEAAAKTDEVLTKRLNEAAHRLATLKRQFLPSFHQDESTKKVVARHRDYLKKVFPG